MLRQSGFGILIAVATKEAHLWPSNAGASAAETMKGFDIEETRHGHGEVQ